MKFCPNCGSKVKPSWKVCAECGVKLDKDDALPDQAQSDESKRIEPKREEPKHVERAEKRSEEKESAPESVAKYEKKEKSERAEKKSSGGLKWLIAAFAILLILGGVGLLALSGLFFLSAPKAPATIDNAVSVEKQCGPGYMSDGANCCADKDGSGVCDSREVKAEKAPETVRTQPATSVTSHITTTSSTIPQKAQAASTTSSTTKSVPSTTLISVSATSSTLSQATVTSSTSSLTSTTKKVVTSCANKYGVASDTVIYVYTPKCCERTLNPTIKTVEGQGFVFEYVNADIMTDRDQKLLNCYLSDSYINVPQLICPANGNRKLISERGVLDQVLSFAKECKEYV